MSKGRVTEMRAEKLKDTSQVESEGNIRGRRGGARLFTPPGSGEGLVAVLVRNSGLPCRETALVTAGAEARPLADRYWARMRNLWAFCASVLWT